VTPGQTLKIRTVPAKTGRMVCLQLGKQTNTEHGEENLQMKEHGYVHR